jgi:4-aminobutyrate aminotransferase
MSTPRHLPAATAPPGHSEPSRTEGDINLSSRHRQFQSEHLSQETTELLTEDAAWFLHQSLSTPCLNALQGTRGTCLILPAAECL